MYKNRYNAWTIEQYREWLDSCMHCGGCAARGPVNPHNNVSLPPHLYESPNRKCPSLEYFKFRSHSGMGRLLIAASVFRDHTPITDDMTNIAYTCSSCGICNEICPTHGPMNAILALRQEIVDQGKTVPAPLNTLWDNMQNKKNLFGLEERASKALDLPSKAGDMYFTGCYTSYLLPKIARANVAILKEAGLDLGHLGTDEHCCGEVARQSGNIELFKEMARANIQQMKDAGAKRVIVNCAHCYRTWHTDYPAILGEKLPFEVVHVADLLAELIENRTITPQIPIEKTVTFHDPCFLREDHEDNASPRTVLDAIPGIKREEMERWGRWSYCCGSGGKIATNCYPDFAAGIGTERVDEAKEVADHIVTSCAVCYNQLRYTVEANHVENMDVEDLSIMLADSMGLAY